MSLLRLFQLKYIKMSTKTIHIQGMTCQGCVKHVRDSLESLPHVSSATVSLEEGTANLELQSETPLITYQEAIGDSYKIVVAGVDGIPQVTESKPSKLKQLRPLVVGLFRDYNFYSTS